MFVVSAFTRRNFAQINRHLFRWGFAGHIVVLLPSRVAGRTLGLCGPDLASGPEVARLFILSALSVSASLWTSARRLIFVLYLFEAFAQSCAVTM